MRKNRFFCLFLIAGIILLVQPNLMRPSGTALYGQSKAGSGGQQITIARAHYHAFHLLAPTVAQDKGFFEGIKVNILPKELKSDTSNGDELLSLMSAQNIDIVVDARIRVLFSHDASKGGLYLLGGWLEGANEISKLVAQKGIKSFKDFKGKRVGTTARESENATTLVYWLRRNGLDPERDVTWVLGLSREKQNAQALRDGKIDIGLVSDVETPGLVKEGYNVVLDYEKLYPEGRPERVIVARRQFVDKNPEAVKAFLKGMLRGYRLVNDWKKHDDYLKSVMQRLFATTKDNKGEDYVRFRMLENGTVSLVALQKVLDEEKELGHVDKSVTLDSIAREKLFDEVVAEMKRANLRY